MPANTAAIFGLTPNCTAVAIPATADTSRTAPSNTTLVFTAGSNGARLDAIVFTATGTTTAGVLRVFQKISSTYYLIGEILVSAITPSGTVACWTGTWRPAGSTLSPPIPYTLKNAEAIYITTHNAEAFTAQPMGIDF